MQGQYKSQGRKVLSNIPSRVLSDKYTHEEEFMDKNYELVSSELDPRMLKIVSRNDTLVLKENKYASNPATRKDQLLSLPIEEESKIIYTEVYTDNNILARNEEARKKNKSKGFKINDKNEFLKNLTSIIPKEIDSIDLQTFLTEPLPKNRTLMCKVVITANNKIDKLLPKIYLHINNNSKMLMVAKRVLRATSTNYFIMKADEKFDDTSKDYLGKISSNWIGNIFNIFDNGYNPKKAVDEASKIRSLLGSIVYVLKRLFILEN